MNELGVLATPQMKQKYRNKLDDGADQNAWAQESSLRSDACEWTWWGGLGRGVSPDSLGETVHWSGTVTDLLILFLHQVSCFSVKN